MAASETHWEDLIKSSITAGLPGELVVKIILQLPVKSLCRFRCVSKGWKSSFSDPQFIKRHLHESALKGGDYVLLEHEFSNCDRETFCMRDSESFEVIENLKLPIQITFGFYEVVDCINGLICLAESQYSGPFLASNTIFWNPAIKEVKVVPACRVLACSQRYKLVARGFAYDSRTGDYKFVRILHHRGLRTYEAEVYSLGKNSWKVFNVCISGVIQGRMSQAFTNGALHWKAMEGAKEDYSGEYILTYIVKEDSFGKIKLPAFESDNIENQKCVSLYRGRLSVLVLKLYSLMDNCDIWIMKKYQDRTSWTRLYTISLFSENLKLLGILNRGKLVVEVRDRVIQLCDFCTDGKNNFRVAGPTYVIKYKESMVSPTRVRCHEPVSTHMVIGEDA